MKKFFTNAVFVSGVLSAVLSSVASAGLFTGHSLTCKDDQDTMTGFTISPISNSPGEFRFLKYDLKEKNGSYVRGKTIYNRVLAFDYSRTTGMPYYYDRRNQINLDIVKMESEEGTHSAELSDYTEDREYGRQTIYTCK